MTLIPFLLLCGWLGPNLAGQADDSCLEQIELRDPQRVADCLKQLRAQPQRTLEEVLPRWSEFGLVARRRLAAILAELGAAELCETAAVLAQDPDLEVRRAWLGFLSRADHAGREQDARVQQLARLASEDLDANLRLDALGELASVGGDLAARSLEEALVDAGAEERRLAAALLSDVPRSGDRLLALVQRAFAEPETSALDSEVLALLLPAYGRRLAEKDGAGGTVRERLPFVQGETHPAIHVRRGARAAFEAWIQRMRARGDGARAIRMLEQLPREGFDVRIALDQRIRIGLSWGSDPEDAIRAARELSDYAEPLRFERDRSLQARALYLESLGRVSLGEYELARERLALAGRLLEHLLAERRDLATRDLDGDHGEALRMLALVELATALTRLAEGEPASDPRVVESMRRVHRLSLEIHRTALRAGRGGRDTLDSILGAALSPFSLWFLAGSTEAWPAARCLEMQQAIGEALACVAPREVPGFAPSAAVQEPFNDGERFGLYLEIERQLLESLDEWIAELRELPDDPLVRARILQLRRRKVVLLRDQREAQESGDFKHLEDHRGPCSLALWQVRSLRAEGRTTESRNLAEAARKGLEDTGQYQDNSILAAELEMGIGASWSDEDEPERAERELTRALERLQALEATQLERGAGEGAVAQLRAIRSEALVSLAVNANVKLLDPERALEYFEQAFELRQDEFMSVLLACYRARSGRADEARAALAEVVPSPNLYYNLACTWALLGENESALEYLRLEFEENHSSVESRNRQREWASEDPDLESLREEPRFQALVEKQ